jgi:hypothetical protein
LFNHTTKECRKIFCEICGYSNHSTYECKRCVLWNTGPELCAAHVEEQSFFFIEECIDPKISKEKECIGVIHIIQGHATRKQIEQQFSYLVGSSSWKWNARQIGENKFAMRFPNAVMVRDWSKCKALVMNDVDALMKLEPWSPKIGAKGMLQMGWFRVTDIPGDQRSIRAIAKVGGLVGKVMEIDERTRFRADYVRVKIACRNLQKIPNTTEGTLGLCIHDFGFEREVPEENPVKTLTSGIVVGSKEPPSKKFKADDHDKHNLQTGASGQSVLMTTETGSNK